MRKQIAILTLLILVIQTSQGQTPYSKSFDILGCSKLYGYQFIVPSLDKGYIMTTATATALPIIKTDSAGNIEWAKRYYFGGSTVEIGYSLISSSPDSGFIIPGIFQDTSISYYKTKMCVIKTDKSGNPLWSKLYGDSSIYSFAELSLSLDDGYAICGEYWDTLLGIQNGILLVKIDFSGNFIWARKINIYSGTKPIHFTRTQDNGIIIISAEGWNLFLSKIDSLGNLLWSNSYDSPNGAEGLYVTETNNGNIMVSGRTMSWGNMDDWDAYLMKFNSEGIYQWGKTYGNPFMPDEAYSVTQLQDGNYVVCAEVESFFGDVSQTALIKTDSIGNLIWMKLIQPDSLGSFPYNAVLNSDGSLTIAGIDGTYSALANVTLIRTDQNLITDCPELIVTPLVTSIPYLNYTSVGTIDSISGEINLTAIEIPLNNIEISNLCDPSYIEEPDISIGTVFINQNSEYGMLIFDNEKNEKFTLSIINISGQIVRTISNITSGEVKIDKNNLCIGLYFFKLQTDSQVNATGKFIID